MDRPLFSIFSSGSARGTLLLPLPTVSLRQWEFSIYSPFGHSFQPRSLLRNAGINAGDMGRHMDMALISSLNWEIATASPINHNEATSGSVKVENVLHLRRVLGQTRLYSSRF